MNKEINRIYNLLQGTYNATREVKYNKIKQNEINQFNSLLNKLFDITQDNYFHEYTIKESDYYNTDRHSGYCLKDQFLLKLLPVLEYIKNEYMDTKEQIVQKVGALYNAIEDAELKRRCGDILLEGTDAFDRVFNQATQVLEDRIKKKAKSQDSNLTGFALVSKAIHSKLEKTILKFSNIADIQEKYSELFKGIIGVYRNPTHHGVDYECTREQALKFCAYIDNLLQELNRAEYIERT